MLFKHEPDCIPWNGDIPEELQRMLVDYLAITNHLIMLGLHHRVGLETHYYPLADGDESKRRRTIPADRELRDLGKDWFVKHYKGTYKVHYLNSAASFAMQHIKSWRSLGGDITALPYVRKPIARLDNDLYSIKDISPDGSMSLIITIAPGKSVSMNIKVGHRHFADWSMNRKGALVILPHGLRLVFTDDAKVEIERKDGAAAIDTNLDRIVISRDDGKIKDIDIMDVVSIQKNHKRKRESVQRSLSHNPKKAERLLARGRDRESNRISDRLHKKIHGKDNGFLSFVGKRVLGVEDLSSTTRDVLRKDRGRRFNDRLSKWVHGDIEDILRHHHIATKDYYTRGTSGFCPFDGHTLKTNYKGVWKHSYCPVCDEVYDRDHLEAVQGLLRLMVKHEKGRPWVTVKEVFDSKVEAEFRKNSIITFTPTDVGTGTFLPETVSPFAPSVPSAVQSKSDIDTGQVIGMMHVNRNDAYDKESSNKTGYDAKIEKIRSCPNCP